MIINLVSLFFFVVYLSFLGYMLEGVLVRVFYFERNWRTLFLGIFGAFWLVGSLAGAGIVFWKFSTAMAVGVLGLTAIIVSLFHCFIVGRRSPRVVPSPLLGESGREVLQRNWNNLKSVISRHQTPLSVSPLKGERSLYEALVILFFTLDAIGFYLLAISKTGSSLATPWQTISPYFIYFFAAATLVLGLLIYRSKSPGLLVLLVAHTFLLHSYLPLTHSLIYGADGWRHIASEANILDGNSIAPAVVTDDSRVWSATFLIGKLAYSQLWGISVMLAKISGLSLIEINKWLLPVVWSLFVPILLFEIGKSLGWSTRRSLLLVWLSFLPYALQAGGSFTLPVNLGFISWLFLILLMLKREEKPEPQQLLFLIGGGMLLVFGYTLFTILFWMGWLLLEILKRTNMHIPTIAIGGVCIVLCVSCIVLLEWVFGYSGIRPSGFLSGFTQMIGNFTSYYLANGPRPHAIATGNVIFNQAPTYAFVVNLFTIFRWWLVAFMIIFLLTVKFGWIKYFRSQNFKLQWLSIITAGLFIAYVISRYFLPGEHLLTRRLEIVLAFLMLVLFVAGVNAGKFLISNFQFLILQRRTILTLGIIIYSIAITASYSLGPNTGTISTDEYAAMKFVNAQIGDDKPCVIAGTFPLLGLQAISKGKIVGGGFPIDHNFAQPELKSFYNPQNTITEILYNVELTDKITKAGQCWLLVENSNLTDASSTVFGSVEVRRVP